MSDRIKQINYFDSIGLTPTVSYPIGVDAIFTDLIDGLNLEDELKIGGNHLVDIVQNEELNQTQITDTYYNKNNEEICTVEYILPRENNAIADYEEYQNYIIENYIGYILAKITLTVSGQYTKTKTIIEYVDEATSSHIQIRQILGGNE